MTNSVFISIFVGALVGLGVFFLFYTNQENAHCAKWETKWTHQEAHTTFVWNGKFMTPIFHPAKDYQRKVCVEAK